jgi:TPR repeat protein
MVPGGARKGHSEAAFRMGEMHYQGIGVARDYTEAANWYQRAARAGSARAQFNLALMVERGRGVQRDAKLAANWYLRAANAGLVPAQLNLAMMYAAGNGVPLNPVQAMMWLRITEHMGTAPLNNVKKGIVAKLSPDQAAEAEGAAADRYQFIRANMVKSKR